jgi:excisionase family DNA binding protein
MDLLDALVNSRVHLEEAQMSAQLVAISDAARTLGVSVYTIRRLVARGDVAAVNVGARRLIPASEVDRIMQRGVGQARSVKARRSNAKQRAR